MTTAPSPSELESLEQHFRRRQRWRDRLARHLVLGPRHASVRWLTVAWAVAVAARLGLLQAGQPSWRISSALLVVSAVGLLVWGGRLFWLLSACGLAIPLLFHRDWLTQTVILLLIASVGALTVHRPAQHSEAQQARGMAAVMASARWLVVATYALAAFHKLNRDFFDPGVSCAVEALVQLDTYLAAVDVGSTGPVALLAPLGVVLVETTIAVTLVRWRRLAIPLALLFHVPMTLVLAPAFVFVMCVGYAAAMDDADRRAVRQTLRQRGPWVLGTTALLAVLLWLGMGRFPVLPDACRQLWLLFMGVLAAWTVVRQGPGEAPAHVRAPAASRWCAIVAVALFAANGLTPYAGTQVQHTGAMLSNLRIDAGCWNHWLVPESVRRVEPYVRIDEARVGSEGRYSAIEGRLRDGLWSVTALQQMRRNWCRPETRPIALFGTHRGERFAIDDLCGPQPLPLRDVGVWGGSALLPDFLRLQKNLERRCPQQCLH